MAVCCCPHCVPRTERPVADWRVLWGRNRTEHGMRTQTVEPSGDSIRIRLCGSDTCSAVSKLKTLPEGDKAMSVLRCRYKVSYSRNSPTFMEPDGSLPVDKSPKPVPSTEPDESCPHPFSSSLLLLCLTSRSFLQVFHKTQVYTATRSQTVR
jgi:hypothetical protein